MSAPNNIAEARKAALYRLLNAAAGLAGGFESGRQAAATLRTWLDQGEVVDELVNQLPNGPNDASDLNVEDPVVTVLELVTSIIPKTEPTVEMAPEDLANYEPAVETAQELAPQSDRWADFEDDDDWVPEILAESSKKSAAVTTSEGPASYEPAVVMAQGLAPHGSGSEMIRDSIDHTSLEPAVAMVPEPAFETAHRSPAEFEPAVEMADDSASWGSSFQVVPLPASEVQNPDFMGYWLDEQGYKHCYLGQDNWVETEEWGYKEGYYWDRHPFTPKISAYERTLLPLNSVAFGSPRELLHMRGLGRNPAILRDELPVNPAGYGQRMRAKAQQASHSRQGSVISMAPAPGAEAVEHLPPTSSSSPSSPSISSAASNRQPAASGPASEEGDEVSDTSSPLAPSPPTQVPAPAYCPPPIRYYSPEYFLANYGHYPTLGQRQRKGPKRIRLQDIRPSWASKGKSPVKSLRGAYRKAGEKVVEKLCLRFGAF
ncbi:hypothetical protein ABW19_dt0204952 [Dactylella cylindrospora]|nr:hypothetical protein ABW19_dt0204952 [Dactylella cylindrospora]